MTGSSAERAIAAAHSSSECTPTTEPSCARSAAMSVARAPAAAGALAAAGGLRALAFQPTRSHRRSCRISRYGCTVELTCAAHAASRFCVLGGSLQARLAGRVSRCTLGGGMTRHACGRAPVPDGPSEVHEDRHQRRPRDAHGSDADEGHAVEKNTQNLHESWPSSHVPLKAEPTRRLLLSAHSAAHPPPPIHPPTHAATGRWAGVGGGFV